MASSGVLFFSYHNDARSNKHQIQTFDSLFVTFVILSTREGGDNHQIKALKRCAGKCANYLMTLYIAKIIQRRGK